MHTSVTPKHTLNTLSLDFGNFNLKSFNGKTLQTIRSLQTPLAKGQKTLKATDASPIIERDGQRWHVGSQCSRYPSTQATVKGDKTQLAQLHLSACVAVSGQYQLIVSHHSPDDYRDFLGSALRGRHSYTRNGQSIHITVQSVEVIAEGFGAYQLAKMRNYILGRGYTVLIDLGGSTWLSTVYAPDGEVIDHDAHERQGTFALAAAIAKDERLAKPLIERYSVSSPNPVLVQDGFTQGHFYGESDLCWADWLPEYLDPWWKNIIQTLKARYQDKLPSVRRFLVTGGGSKLIAHKLASSQAFLVMPEADTASVQGAYLTAQSAITRA